MLSPTNQGASSAPTKKGGRHQFQELSRKPHLVLLCHLTPLTHLVSVILDQAKEKEIVQFLEECMKISPKIDQTKYCTFYQKVRHDTNECIILNRQIEELIQTSYFGQFSSRRQRKRKSWRRSHVTKEGDHPLHIRWQG